MERYKNATIIGTSHISKQSIVDVEKVIETENPRFVAVELDRRRYLALASGAKSNFGIKELFQLGFGGYLLFVVGHFIEKRLARIVEINLGSEMLRACEIGMKNGCSIAFIDQDIKITLRNFSRYFNYKEKFKLVFDILKGVIKRENIEIDLRKVPKKELIAKVMQIVENRYPGMYKALVADRNLFMANKISRLMEQGSVVAIVGAGHVDGIVKQLKEIESNKNKEG